MTIYASEYLNITNESEYLSAIQEVQFENPKIKEIELLIHELRVKYARFDIKDNRINADPIIKDISILFEEAFGFYSFQLSVDHSKFPNAYTAPISSKIDAWNYKKCVQKTNEGVKFTQTAKVNTIAVITTSLLLDTKFTDREIVAILLHEIGHNFSDSINKTLGIFSNFKKVMLIPYLFINPHNASNKLRGKATTFTRYMRENHVDIVNAFNSAKMFISTLDYIYISINRALSVIPQVAVANLTYILKQLAMQVVTNPIGVVMNTIFNFFGKEDEYTSDSFVAMYGYGTDLSSALIKLERHNHTVVDEVFKSGEFGAMYFALMVESIDFIGALFSDNHPSTANRLLNVLNTLEKEYSKSYINPKFKKETKKEIDEVRKLIEEEMINRSFEGNYWRIKWNQFILSNKKNKGPKDEMIEELLEKLEEIGVNY